MSTVTPQVLGRNAPAYKHISFRFDAHYGALWLILDLKPRACFSFDVLDELHHFLGAARSETVPGVGPGQMRYFIVASRTPGVFNLGGDLEMFAHCVSHGDRETLQKYAVACIDALYPYIVAFDLPCTTISLVQGDAMGGGLEVALAADIVIAEQTAQLGFPEVLFNLFPGMGAYSLLHRRIGMHRTEQLLLTGKLYSAAEFHEEGLVDVLVEAGRGEKAVLEFIARNTNRQNAQEAVRRVRRRLCPIHYKDLLDVTEIWVNAAMQIGMREIRLMERLARAQERGYRQEPLPLLPSATITA